APVGAQPRGRAQPDAALHRDHARPAAGGDRRPAAGAAAGGARLAPRAPAYGAGRPAGRLAPLRLDARPHARARRGRRGERGARVGGPAGERSRPGALTRAARAARAARYRPHLRRGGRRFPTCTGACPVPLAPERYSLVRPVARPSPRRTRVTVGELSRGGDAPVIRGGSDVPPNLRPAPAWARLTQSV